MPPIYVILALHFVAKTKCKGCLLSIYDVFTYLRVYSYYVGEVKNGLRHGQGDFYCAKSKYRYFGQWHLGKRHGKGRLVYDTAKECYYDGQWVENMKQGFGIERYK